MKQHVDIFDYSGHLCKALKKGILLTSKSGNALNTMTIGWGTIGIQWNKPIFIAYVRESRFTKQLLEENGEFTINIPHGDFDSNILRHCGRTYGRDTDKFTDLGLTTEEPECISVPGIRELPLTLECKVIYKQKQDLAAIDPEHIARFYPVEGDDGYQDYHIAYYGEIVSAYLIR